MHIAILGRQPALSMAELERVFGSDRVEWFSDTTATIDSDAFTITRLGGTLKAGRIISHLPSGDWRRVSSEIVRRYTSEWNGAEGKITLGISAYGFSTTPRDVQKTGILLKQNLKKSGVSLRLIPNTEVQLNTATSHHNKLGLSDNKVELIVVRGKSGNIIIAESTGSQNISALSARDQARPKRDSFVGMLPPKLAQIMINLAGTPSTEHATDAGSARHAPTESSFTWTKTQSDEKDTSLRLLDPFCGTGVILQEAALMGFRVYGTDLSEKMVDYSMANLAWLASSHSIPVDATIRQADAMEANWQPPISVVVAETYLGQPFSAPPSPPKLEEVRRNANHIITSFLKNIAPQLRPGTSLCLAVPAWRSASGSITHLPLIGSLRELGYATVPFTSVSSADLIYYREDQVVARELLVLVRA